MFLKDRLCSVGALLLAGIVSLAGASLPFEAVPGTPMVQTADFGELPQEIVWKKDGATMILIPAGSFEMGTANGPVDERPVRTVTLPSYYIDKYEVTNEQFMRYVRETGGSLPNVDSESDLAKDSRPVVAVSWNQARDFARWAHKEIPTEAMWERAARGPENVTNILPFSASGGDLVIGLGQAGLPVDAKADTTDVSGYGLHFMTTNVREWVFDWYSPRGYRADELEDPQGVDEGDARTVRGGSYYSPRNEENFRVTTRSQLVPTQTRDDVGFRTVFVLRPAPEATPSPTPMPTSVASDPNERRDASVAVVQEALRNNEPRLGPDQRSRPDSQINGTIGNLSPFRLHVALVDARGGVTSYGTVLEPCSFTSIPVPAFRLGTRIYLYAAAEIGDEPLTLQNLGEISASENLMTILPARFFTQLLDTEGNPIEDDGRTEAFHYYNKSYSPQWDEVLFQSNLTVPARIKLQNKAGTETFNEFTIAPGDRVFLKTPGMTYQLLAEYVGATEASAVPWELRVDDTAAFRVMTFHPDTEREDRVRVFSQRVPHIRFELKEARVPLGYLPTKR